jgi:hypothetical protein
MGACAGKAVAAPAAVDVADAASFPVHVDAVVVYLSSARGVCARADQCSCLCLCVSVSVCVGVSSSPHHLSLCVMCVMWCAVDHLPSDSGSPSRSPSGRRNAVPLVPVLVRRWYSMYAGATDTHRATPCVVAAKPVRRRGVCW